MASNTFPGTKPKHSKFELSDSKEWEALEVEALQESLSEVEKAIIQKAKEIDTLKGQLSELKSSFGPKGKITPKESPISSDGDSIEESPPDSPTVKFPTHSTLPPQVGKVKLDSVK